MTRRTRRRVEAVLVLLAFPLAIALTVLTLVVPPATSRPAPEPARATAAAPARVAVRGGDPLVRFGLGDALTAMGYDVSSIDGDGNSVPPTTQVVYYRREHRAAAERLRSLLGTGTIRRAQVFSPSSDVTIHIGKDLHTT